MEDFKIEQSPVISFDKLDALGSEVRTRIDSLNVSGQVATTETIKSIKEMRSDLNKEFKEYEDARKTIKEKILKPYDDFNESYKRNIEKPYKDADAELKKLVLKVQKEHETIKTQQLTTYLNEYCSSKKIDFITLDAVNLNITASASMKSLRDKVTNFVDGVEQDLSVIDLQSDLKDQILIEYKSCFNLSQSIHIVKSRSEQLEELEKKKIEEQNIQHDEPKEEPKPIIEEPIILEAPKIEEPEETFTLGFEVTATLKELKALKEYMINNNLKFK